LNFYQILNKYIKKKKILLDNYAILVFKKQSIMNTNIDKSTNTKNKLTSKSSKSSKKDPIKICINNFWQNAFDGDFFQHLLNLACDNNYEVVEDGNNADVVISSVFGNIRYPKDKTIFIIGENIRPNFRICKYSLSMDVDNYCGHNCHLPLWYCKIAWPGFKYKVEKTITSHNREGHGYIPLSSLTAKRKLLNKRNKFCALIAGNPEILRVNMFMFLNTYYKKVDGFGPLFGSIAQESKFEILQDYKFCLCPENGIYPGYITEKLIEAWFSGTIPIWSGHNFTGSGINEKAFVNYQNFNDMREFIIRIINLDQNEDDYKYIYEQPLLLKSPELEPVVEFLKNSIIDIIK
tara:strand:- start:1049 stop:2095 length:1047 start_codon:yes stop_codon:yes gene_type:complete